MYPNEYRFHINGNTFEVLLINFLSQTIIVEDKGSHIPYPISSGILIPYTGVRDDFNKKLYVGDIVQVTPMLVENIPTYTAVIEWDKYRFALRNQDKQTGYIFLPPYTNLDPFGIRLVKIGSIHN